MDELTVIPSAAEAAGQELHSYTSKKYSDDGKFVVITTHKEELKMIPQPLTEEEKAALQEAERRENRNALVAIGVVFVGFLGFVGLATWADERQRREASSSERTETGS